VVAVLAGSACSQNPERPPPQHACAALAPGAMRWIPAGHFVQGQDPQYPEEGPPRTVTVPGFWIDTHELTNAEFAAFVKATGY
ncbi:cysteine-type sulfatase aerobic maturase, partial [Pseudomonas sp. FW305-130]